MITFFWPLVLQRSKATIKGLINWHLQSFNGGFYWRPVEDAVQHLTFPCILPKKSTISIYGSISIGALRAVAEAPTAQSWSVFPLCCLYLTLMGVACAYQWIMSTVVPFSSPLRSDFLNGNITQSIFCLYVDNVKSLPACLKQLSIPASICTTILLSHAAGQAAAPENSQKWWSNV